MTDKVTVAHLKFNYYCCDSIYQARLAGDRVELTGYRLMELPGEGAEVQEKMDYAILNYSANYGLYNMEIIKPEEYASATI
tara:strand:+ start:565 stop:807 length:243 start_codon:yes stop_codon:yes gene_type:complete